MENYFAGTKARPYHLSVAAVVINEDGNICCHYFKQSALRKKFNNLKDFYILMRETMELGETLEQTCHRGLMEEFGMTGEIITYLGSIKSTYPIDDQEIEKTTLYFLVKPINFDPALRSPADPEKDSTIEWQPVDFLIDKMKEQELRLGSSLNESPILERARTYLANLPK